MTNKNANLLFSGSHQGARFELFDDFTFTWVFDGGKMSGQWRYSVATQTIEWREDPDACWDRFVPTVEEMYKTYLAEMIVDV